MMYVFICTDCGQVRMVSGLREAKCPRCNSMMAAYEGDFLDWTNKNKKKKKKIVEEYKRRAKTEQLVRYRPMPVYDRKECGYDY